MNDFFFWNHKMDFFLERKPSRNLPQEKEVWLNLNSLSHHFFQGLTPNPFIINKNQIGCNNLEIFETGEIFVDWDSFCEIEDEFIKLFFQFYFCCIDTKRKMRGLVSRL